jgi:glycolate oxidase FAD binding subunit
MDSVSIDGLALSAVKPVTVAELCTLVKSQRAKKEAVYPVGGRTMLDYGLPPTKPGLAVDTTALNQVIDHAARDMTITVQAGITFAKLQEALAKENQWLPLDAPDPERMTLGGLIACNVSGPRRYGYGTLRDYLIGIEFVSDDGAVIHGGGRVVKNVAGYDLMKLNIGALGTMGVITQATLKVLPKPEAIQISSLPKMGYLDLQLDLLARTQSRPIAVGMDRDHILVAFEGAATRVHHQLEVLARELSDSFDMDWTDLSGNDAIRDLCRLQIDSSFEMIDSTIIVEYSMKPSEVAGFLQSHAPDRIDHVSEPLNGIVRSLLPDDAVFRHDIAHRVRRAPTAWKTPERVFGKPTPAWDLMAHIKRTLDPENLFNPGRMFQ